MILTAFILLALAFGSRLYFVLRFGSSTTFLGAMGIGLVGLFSTGVVISEVNLDGLLGGYNVLHLLRNLAVTYAVWLIREGVMSAFGSEALRGRFIYRRRFLVLVTIAIVIPFLCQRFVPTTESFVPENVDQVPVLAYATIYMAALLFLAASVVKTCLAPQSSRAVRVSARGVAFGMTFMAVACVDEILFMQLQALNLGSEGLRGVLYGAFAPLLYGGVLLVSLSLALPLLIRIARAVDISNRIALVVLEVSSMTGIRPGTSTGVLQRAKNACTRPDPSGALYEHIIRESDRRVNSGYLPLPGVTQRTLTAAEDRFNKSFDLTLPKSAVL